MIEPTRIFTGRSTIRMYNRDCMELLESGKTWDLAIVDPPYGIARFGNRIELSNRLCNNAKINKWDTKPTQRYFKNLLMVSEGQIIWGANNFILPTSEYFIVWDKEQTVDNFASAEYAWTNIKKPAKIYRYSIHKVMAQRKFDGGKIHPTQKPVKLYKWLLHNYAKQGDTILDTHGGSMSIAIACWDLGYDLDICELDTDYFNDAVKRFENHIAQTNLFAP